MQNDSMQQMILDFWICTRRVKVLSYIVACAQTVPSEKICASSNSPIPNPHPRPPPFCRRSQQCQTPRLPAAPSAPASNLHTWSLRRTMPNCWDRAAGQPPKGHFEAKAEPLRSTAVENNPPCCPHLRQTSDYVSLAKLIQPTLHTISRAVAVPTRCRAPCLGPRLFRAVMCRMTWPCQERQLRDLRRE